jgi:pyruvate dehydrogenase E2 component (dihydrolipoamide acetyltransferase)
LLLPQKAQGLRRPAPAKSEEAPKEAAETAEVAVADESHSSVNGRVKASPLAKRLAAEKGIDISKVNGSGDGGRIVKSDIDNYKPAAAGKEMAPAAKTPAAAEQPAKGFKETPVSQMRR